MQLKVKLHRSSLSVHIHIYTYTHTRIHDKVDCKKTKKPSFDRVATYGKLTESGPPRVGRRMNDLLHMCLCTKYGAHIHKEKKKKKLHGRLHGRFLSETDVESSVVGALST